MTEEYCPHVYYHDPDIEENSGPSVICNQHGSAACESCGWNPEVAKARLDEGRWETRMVDLDLYTYDDLEHVTGTRGTSSRLCRVLMAKTYRGALI